MNKIIVILFNIIILSSCAGKKMHTDQDIISVSIAPIAYFTDRIVGDDFEVNILVPTGSSPETYEVTAMQMKKVANSRLFINIGLIDFESNLNKSIADLNPNVKILKLSDDIDLIDGDPDSDDHDAAAHSHHHGTDPHIWTTPSIMKQIAEKIYTEIHAIYPDSAKYTENYIGLLEDIDALDRELTGLFEDGQRNFLIYHPALSYLARDYGLNQIAVEYEGKELSAEHMKSLINQSKELKINKILYQIEFSKNTVDALSKELGIETVMINPLAYEILDNILKISILIAR